MEVIITNVSSFMNYLGDVFTTYLYGAEIIHLRSTSRTSQYRVPAEKNPIYRQYTANNSPLHLRRVRKHDNIIYRSKKNVFLLGSSSGGEGLAWFGSISVSLSY